MKETAVCVNDELTDDLLMMMMMRLDDDDGLSCKKGVMVPECRDFDWYGSTKKGRNRPSRKRQWEHDQQLLLLGSLALETIEVSKLTSTIVFSMRRSTGIFLTA